MCVYVLVFCSFVCWVVVYGGKDRGFYDDDEKNVSFFSGKTIIWRKQCIFVQIVKYNFNIIQLSYNNLLNK